MNEYKNNPFQERLKELHTWVDENFICHLFKPDLELGWFFVYVKDALRIDLSSFDEGIDNLEAADKNKRAIKKGIREFIAFLEQCKEMITDDYADLSEEKKWVLNRMLAQGIIDSTKLLFSEYEGPSVEEEVFRIQAMFSDWQKYQGVWVNRLKRENPDGQ